MTRRVVVTGIGCVSPVGLSAESSWAALVEGRSGVATIPDWVEPRFNGSPLPVTIGARVKNFEPKDWISPAKDIRRMDRFIQLALAAGVQAWDDADLPDRLDDSRGDRAGALIGCGLGGIETLIKENDKLFGKGPRRVSAFMIPALIGNLAPGHLAIRFNLRNHNWAPASACASGAHGIGEALMEIRSGRADLMLAGGTEAAVHSLAASGFAAMHALCVSKNDDPEAASRPFDKGRDGFVMGEGAGVLVLEELEVAKARGARIRAELVGYGSTSDASHITAPAPGGEGAQRAMRNALSMGGLNPEEVAYINAHGTSTPFNDSTETQAIRGVFQEHADRIAVSSTKSMTGHLLGAAGGVEAVFSVLTIQKSVVPPTINRDEPDPDCDLDVVPHEARDLTVDVAMSNSFGFGGTNAVLVFRRFTN